MEGLSPRRLSIFLAHTKSAQKAGRLLKEQAEFIPTNTIQDSLPSFPSIYHALVKKQMWLKSIGSMKPHSYLMKVIEGKLSFLFMNTLNSLGLESRDACILVNFFILDQIR